MIRTLWDLWWREAGETLPEDVTWRLNNIRPQNAPVRRLAAAASLFSGLSDILHDLDRLTAGGERWHVQARNLFDARCRWPFWNRRLTFASAPDEAQNISLLGDARAAAVITNAVLPLAAAEDRLPSGALEQLPPEDISSPMRLAALYLFGRDHNPALYAGNGLLQQGLLQIYLDFCLNAKPGCDACALHESLSAHASTG